MAHLLDNWVYPEAAVGRDFDRNYGIAGSPLMRLVWKRDQKEVALQFRKGTSFDDKLAFLDQLVEGANRLRSHLLMEPEPDYKPKEIDWAAVRELAPKIDFSAYGFLRSDE